MEGDGRHAVHGGVADVFHDDRNSVFPDQSLEIVGRTHKLPIVIDEGY